VSTAAPEALHRCGATPRAGTPRRPYMRGETTQLLQHPCDAMSARRSSFRLPAMASLLGETRRKLLIGQHMSRIVRGADSRHKLPI
jgi:hypothetical protein